MHVNLQHYACLFLLTLTTLTNAQFALPKVAADTPQYNAECIMIVKSGIKKRYDYTHPIRNNQASTQNYKEREVSFDNTGRIKEYLYLDEDSRKKAIITFEYYPNGLPKTETQFYPTGEMLTQTKYIFNSESDLKEISKIDQYGYVISKTIFSTNNETHTITEKKHPYPQVVSDKDIWTYSDLKAGHLVKHTKYKNNNELQFTRTLVYKNNKIEKEIYTNPAGNVAFFLEYTYNNNMQVIEIEKVLLDGSRLKNTLFNYNSAGLIIRKINYDRYGNLESYYTYQYN